MERELPVGLIDLVESVRENLEEKLTWIKCDSKLNWTLSAFKTGEEKEKAAITLNYVVASAHPNVRECQYTLSLKVNLDRMVELTLEGLYFDDLFDVVAKVHLTESQLTDIPVIIGKYLDLKTSSLVKPVLNFEE